MAALLQRAWRQRGVLAWLLLPVSLLYAFAVSTRKALYRAGILKTTHIQVPVIVIGNAVAGGAGKTPVVIALLEHLRSRGLRAGVISRGHGRRGTECLEVHDADDPSRTGDEPLLIKQRTGAPCFVATRRAEAAQRLLAAYPDTQVIVCDDGLQHFALARDIDICVFDERGIGNGWLLPAGPLRERWPRDVDLVLRPAARSEFGGHAMHRLLASEAKRSDGTRIPLTELAVQPLHAVAAIANPEAFFRMLRDRGLQLQTCTSLADHDEFRDAGQLQGGTLVCTEKDAAKLWRSRPDAWAVPLELEIDASFWIALDRLLDAKLSSRHGPETP